MTHRFTAADGLACAEAIGAGEGAPAHPPPLGFTRPFMPEALARTAALSFLSRDERLLLNQIRGNAYLTTVALLDGLAQGVRPGVAAGPGEAAGRLRMAFAAGFAVRCEVIDAAAVAAMIGDAPPLSRALLGLHGVWMAKRHMQAAALNERTLDPAFRRLLLDRWLAAEPMGGGGLLGDAWIGRVTPTEIDAAVAGYRRLCDGLSEALQAQALLDLAALQRAAGRTLSLQQREQTLVVQNHASWWSFIGCGVTHPGFAGAVRRMQPGALAEFDGLIATLA